RSTTPVGNRGALTMKMISSTSITSMNGTMLISLRVRLRRPPPRALSSAIACPFLFGCRCSAAGAGPARGIEARLAGHQRRRIARQDVGELLDEGLHLDGDAVDVAGKAV